MAFAVRPAVIIIRDSKILLLHSKYGDKEFYVLPGGKLEEGETLQACAIREIKEETNLNIQIVKLLYVRDFFEEKNHILDIFFLGKIQSGEIQHKEKNGKILKIVWVPLTQLKSIIFYPKTLATLIPQDYPNFNRCQYLEICE